MKEYIKSVSLKTPKQSNYKIGENIFLECISIHKEQGSPKIYPLGRRLHHGPVCVVVSTIGRLFDNDILVGLGDAGIRDDIDDFPHWLDFESKPK